MISHTAIGTKRSELTDVVHDDAEVTDVPIYQVSKSFKEELFVFDIPDKAGTGNDELFVFDIPDGADSSTLASRTGVLLVTQQVSNNAPWALMQYPLDSSFLEYRE